MSEPCPCWGNAPYLHDGHCCFGDPLHDYAPTSPVPCGHDEEGMARLRRATEDLKEARDATQ